MLFIYSVGMLILIDFDSNKLFFSKHVCEKNVKVKYMIDKSIVDKTVNITKLSFRKIIKI